MPSIRLMPILCLPFLFIASNSLGASIRKVIGNTLPSTDTSAVNTNFNNINNELSNVVHRTGTETISGKKTFSNASVSSATYASNGAPIGSLVMYGASSAPTGWLVCDGTAVSRTTYAALFAILSTTYGTGNGSTTFNLPDFRGVFPKGSGTTTRAAGVDANGSAYAATLGAYVQDKMQGHRHLVPNLTQYVANRTGVVGAVSKNDGPINMEYTGGPTTDGTNGTPRTGATTEPQSLGINFIIKY